MIAKGNPHNSGPYLARYLAASSKGNESAELVELRGFASDNIFDAFASVQLQAGGDALPEAAFPCPGPDAEGGGADAGAMGARGGQDRKAAWF